MIKKRNTVRIKNQIAWIFVFFFISPVIAGNITFQPIYYELGSSTLTKAAKEGLERVAQLLKSNPLVDLRLEPYSGLEGKGIDPQKLSERRGQAAYAHLTQKLGVGVKRVLISAKGTSGLLRPKNSKAVENRRLEFVFLTKEKPKQSGKKLEEVEVLYWNTLYHSLYQIGTAQGYFEEEGFKIKLVATNHSIINQVDAVCGIEPFLREKVTVFTGAVCGGSPHQAAAMGVPLVVIGGMLAGGSMLMAKPEVASKLRADWNNFKGIRIGRPKGTLLTSMIVSDALYKRGIDARKEIIWKEFDSHEAVVEAIAKGIIDAGDTYVPLNIRARKQHGLVEVYNTVQLFPYHPCCRVITTKQKLEKHRKKYVRFMKGLIRSHEFFIKQPRKAIQVVQRYTGYTMEEVSASLTNPNFILNPDPLKNGFVKFWKMMNQTGYLNSKKDINQFIDTSVYEDALKSLMKKNPKNPYYAYMTRKFREQNL